MQHSGSVRHYASRPILRWDMLDPGALDQAVEALRARGYTPVLVADDWEEVDFRKRFGERGQQAAGRLRRLESFGAARVFAFE